MTDFGSSFQDASEHGERATRPARLRAEGASARSRRSFSGGGSAPTKRRARARVGEFEGRSPSNKIRLRSSQRHKGRPSKRKRMLSYVIYETDDDLRAGIARAGSPVVRPA